MAPSNRRFRPHCHLKLKIQRTPANLRISLILLETAIFGYIFAADSMGLCSFVFSWWAPKNTCHVKNASWPLKVSSRSYKVTDLGTNRKSVLGFLLVFNSILGRILHRFGDTAAYRSKNRKNRPFEPIPLSQIALARVTPCNFFDKSYLARE